MMNYQQLEELHRKLDNWADADHNGRNYVPNEAMRLQVRIREMQNTSYPNPYDVEELENDLMAFFERYEIEDPFEITATIFPAMDYHGDWKLKFGSPEIVVQVMYAASPFNIFSPSASVRVFL